MAQQHSVEYQRKVLQAYFSDHFHMQQPRMLYGIVRVKKEGYIVVQSTSRQHEISKDKKGIVRPLVEGFFSPNYSQVDYLVDHDSAEYQLFHAVPKTSKKPFRFYTYLISLDSLRAKFPKFSLLNVDENLVPDLTPIMEYLRRVKMKVLEYQFRGQNTWANFFTVNSTDSSRKKALTVLAAIERSEKRLHEQGPEAPCRLKTVEHVLDYREHEWLHSLREALSLSINAFVARPSDCVEKISEEMRIASHPLQPYAKKLRMR